MNSPNYPNQVSSPTGLTHVNSNMTNYSEYDYGEDDGMNNERNDALQMKPEEYLEEMSKKPAHKRRFSVNSFPHPYQKSQNSLVGQDDEEVWDPVTGELMEDGGIDRWMQNLHTDISEMSEKVNNTAENIKNGFKDDVNSYEAYNFENIEHDHPQIDTNYLRQTLGVVWSDGGVMWKKGQKTGLLSNSKWKQRYFKLDVMGDFPKIYYFDAKSKVGDNNKASGAIHITVDSYVKMPDVGSGKVKKNEKMKNKTDLIVTATSD